MVTGLVFFFFFTEWNLIFYERGPVAFSSHFRPLWLACDNVSNQHQGSKTVEKKWT